MSEAPHDALVPSDAADWGFGRLFGAIKDAVIVADASSGRIRLWNGGAETMFLYSAAEAHDMLLEDLVPPALKEDHRKGLARYAERREGSLIDSDAAVELPALRKDGREILIQLNLSRIDNPQDPSGAYAMGLIRDVTELRDSEQAAKLILDASPQATFALDADGVCTLANPAAATLLGYRTEDLIGANMHALMHHSRPDGSPFPVTECPIYDALRAGRRTHVDTEVFWRLDGTPFPAEYNSEPMLRNGTLLGAVVTFADITGGLEKEARLNRRALTDDLTGIGNRRYADQVLATLNVGDAVVMIDVDHFKRVNDTYGHTEGDRVLVALAHHFASLLRAGDHLARFGGEEFLLVLPGAAQTACAIAQRMADEWAKLNTKITFSAGVAVHDPHVPPIETLGRADAAMYQAKDQGRNRVVQYDPSAKP